MKDQAKNIILYGALLVLGLYFLFQFLQEFQVFFVPLTIAILFAMLLVPVGNRLEKWGISRGLASFLADLILVTFTVILFWVVGMQIKTIKEDWPKLKKELSKQANKLDKKLDQYSWGSQFSVSEKLNKLDPQNGQQQGQGNNKNRTEGGTSQNGSDQPTGQNAGGQNQQDGQQQGVSSGSQNASSGQSSLVQKAWTFIKSAFGFLGSMLLVFIYVFFFLFYREKFHKSVLQFVPRDKNEEANNIINGSSRVAQQYLLGRLMLILFLAVIYSIGFSVSGVKYSILIAVIAAVLSIIPYIGNLIGMAFAAVMALVSGGSGTALIGVVITFSVVQFVESYILEPYIVGHKVDVNPVMTIIIVIFGEFLWGVAGMILAIPVLAIIKVICDHVPPLKPIGYTIGEEGIDQGENKFEKLGKKIKNKFKKDEP